MQLSPKILLSIGACGAAIVLLAAGPKPYSVTAAGDTITISAHFYRLKTAIDVNSIKAIGSAQTKASPSILQVTNAEAARVGDNVRRAGGTLVGSPTVITRLGQAAKIQADSEEGGNSLDVTPTSKGSDTISLAFKLAVTSKVGRVTTTRTARGTARVQETKSLLIIENPRQGQPGLLAVLEAKRGKG